MPEYVQIEVRAIPMDPQATIFSIECSKCEVVGLVAEDVADETCISHLEAHGVDVQRYL